MSSGLDATRATSGDAAPGTGDAALHGDVDQVEATGVVIVVDDRRRVVHVSDGCEQLLGGAAATLLGRPLDQVAGREVDHMLEETLADGLARAGGWWPAGLPDGRQVKIRAFEATEDLIGLDVLTADPSPAPATDSIERVAGWNDWLLSCTTSAGLLHAAASITRERSGFEGVWVCRVEPGGHHTVVANDTGGSSPDLVGQSVLATDLPPSQPRHRGRDLPFFVSDLSEAGRGLVPPADGIDLQGSTLLRPYPAFLSRLSDLGVRATLSLPIVVDGRLWGRVVAHHQSPRRVPTATQSELRLLGAAASARLSELIEQEDAREQVELGRFSLRLMSSVATAPDLLDGLMRDRSDLVGVCAADAAIVAIDGRVEHCGIEGTEAELSALLEHARAAFGPVGHAPLTASVNLDGATGPIPGNAAGYLAVRLGHDVRDIVMWVRGPSTRSVTWVEHEVVGDAVADELFTGMRRREQRTNGTCAPWTAAQLAQVDELREAIGQVQIARYQQVRALNADLQRSNAQYDAFAHAAAHDLKAPLRGIRQYVEFHLEDTRDRLSEEEQAQLHTVMRLSGRMYDLLDDLMAYAQVGSDEWRPRSIELRGAVAETVELLTLPEAALTVDTEATSFTADPVAFRQLLQNLIGNAAKYSDGPAQVTVGVTTLADAARRSVLPETLGSAPGETPVLTVADRGIGIDPAHHERIFTLFHQLDPAADGTGAGLALCRLLCRGQGGDIWLSSTPGAGTTFFVVTAR